ncbi:MAG: PepSY-associated TM helix domain-containing protein [Actinomycetota bacterium]
MKLRRFVFHLHLYTGLIIGLLVSLTGVTGSLLVFGHELDELLYPRLLHAHPPAGQSPATLQTVLHAVSREHPGVTVQSLAPPQSRTGVHDVRLKGGKRVFVDPHTAAILGQRASTDHPVGFVFALHKELLSGENGEKVVGVGGLLLLLLGVTGLYLWWPRKGLRQGFDIKWRGNWKRTNFDLHRVTGAVVVTLLSPTALTGAALVWGAEVTDWTYRVTGAPRRPRLASTPVTGVASLPLDALAARADAALPGAATTRITLAAKPQAAVVFRKRFPREIHPNGMSFVHLDQYSGKVLFVENGLQAPPGPRLLNLRYPLHIGNYGGWVVRILYVLVGLTPALLFTTGCLMWWNRHWVPRRRRRASAATQVAPEGA